MKYASILLLALIWLTACGSDNEPENPKNNQINTIANVLNGKFVNSKYSEATNTTETREITFTPFSSPKTESWTNNGITKDVAMYGTCVFTTYFNDHLLQVDKNWKYNINIAYTGATPELILYPDIYGRTESYDLKVIDNSSISLDGDVFNKKSK